MCVDFQVNTQGFNCITFSIPFVNGATSSSAICEDVRKITLEQLKSISKKIDGFAYGFPCNDFSLVGEQKGIKGDFYSDGIFSGGVAYLMSDNLQVDAAISSSYKNTPSIMYGGIGISWRSDVNYDDIFIRLKKEDDGKKVKGKKDKNKKKKRLDEVEVEKP